MTSLLSKSLLAQDLDFLIDQEPRTVEGISPAGLVGKTWRVGRETMDVAYDVEVNGRQTTVDTRLVVSLSRYGADDAPTKGAVLEDRQSERQFKVVSIAKDDMGLFLRLECASRYQGGA